MDNPQSELTVECILQRMELFQLKGLYQQAAFYMKNNTLNYDHISDKESFEKLFNRLFIESIINDVMKKLIDREISKITCAFRETQVDVRIVNRRGVNICKIGNVDLNKEAVIGDAIKVHRHISRRYSIINATPHPRTLSEEKVEDDFRMASLLLAARVAFVAHLSNAGLQRVMDDLVEELDDPVHDIYLSAGSNNDNNNTSNSNERCSNTLNTVGNTTISSMPPVSTTPQHIAQENIAAATPIAPNVTGRQNVVRQRIRHPLSTSHNIGQPFRPSPIAGMTSKDLIEKIVGQAFMFLGTEICKLVINEVFGFDLGGVLCYLRNK